MCVLALWLTNRQCNHPDLHPPPPPKRGYTAAQKKKEKKASTTNKQTGLLVYAHGVWAVMTPRIKTTFTADYCPHTLRADITLHA